MQPLTFIVNGTVPDNMIIFKNRYGQEIGRITNIEPLPPVVSDGEVLFDKLPSVLFDGFGVLNEARAKGSNVPAHYVADVLDAVVRLLKKGV